MGALAEVINGLIVGIGYFVISGGVTDSLIDKIRGTLFSPPHIEEEDGTQRLGQE